MFNLIQANLYPRLGLASGAFLLWASVFFAFVHNHESPVENLVMVPVMLTALLFGVRGGLLGAVVGVLAISTFHAIGGTAPFTRLLHGGAPIDVAMMASVSMMVGYGRQLEARRFEATRGALVNQIKLDQLDSESQILSLLTSDISTLLTVESILLSAGDALSRSIQYQRLAIYQIEDARVSAKLIYVSGDYSTIVPMNTVVPLAELMSRDPFDDAMMSLDEGPVKDRPIQIVHDHVGDSAQQIAVIRIWSSTKPELATSESRILDSVTTQIVPALKRAALQGKFERVARINGLIGEFASDLYKRLNPDDVVRAAVAHITRGLRHDFLAISVADPERRHLEVRQVVGRPLARLKVGEVMTDPLADQPIKIWTMEECESLKEHSRTAKFVVDSDLGTIILQNLRGNGEFVAQICVGFKDGIDVSADDAEFVSRLGQHLLSALENANNLDALRQLQSQLVGHNEQLTEMQEGVERAENLLRVSNQRLIEQNESKTRLLSEVAHEFKTPLSVVIGYANLLRHDVENLDSEQRSAVGAIERSAYQLTSLIDDLSDIPNIESGHSTISKSSYDISTSVQEIVDGIRISNQKYRDRLEFSASGGGTVINGDASRLGQVFTNLVSNALKYSPSHETISVNIETESEGHLVRIVVSDKGPGISKTDLSELFTPFFRSSKLDALEREGTGLGLFLSRSIVEEHGGTLAASSTIGAGSTFTVDLRIDASSLDVEAA